MKHVVEDSMKMWIIEDNAPDVFLVNMALEQALLQVTMTVITDGEEALAKLESCAAGQLPAPDLLLLDLHLPKASGAEILEAVYRNPYVSRSCLAVTSSLPAPSADIVLRPTDRYIQKSSQLNEFVARIAEWASGCVRRGREMEAPG